MKLSYPTTHLRAAIGLAPVRLRAGWHSHSRLDAGIAADMRGIADAVLQ